MPSVPRVIQLLLLSWLTALGLPTGAGADRTPLIDSSTLELWFVRGDGRATFEFEEEELVGRVGAEQSGNAFLCSPDEYDDVFVTFQFKISSPELNSGFQFRSAAEASAGVAGPQVELDVARVQGTSGLGGAWQAILRWLRGSPWEPRQWPTGGVWDENGTRGWIYPGDAGGDPDRFADQGERLTKVDDWNHVWVEVVGSRVRTWLNGELRAKYDDEQMPPRGRFCFQVHGGDYDESTDLEVRWRRVRIEPRG